MDPMMFKYLTMSAPQPDNRMAGHPLPLFQHSMQHQNEQQQMQDHPHLSLSVASPMEVLDSSRKVVTGGDVEEDNDNKRNNHHSSNQDSRRARMATIFPPMPFVPPRGGGR
jgi:hypothetical protein